ncbi:unnamed protein product [Schistocephalus solidus]|uniref:Uncharacterized protein n=1 Tax=Schistocephalus solidus TaxID=70667 RepID=A0A183T1J5_SCHSO|nr:unnamed protein product [Schistocephalus solidus]
MVERFRRQLKAPIRVADNPENWTDHLSLVLLGINSALKSDLDCSTAELVFGVTIRLPGEMISPSPCGVVENPTNLLHRLRQFMRTLSPVPCDRVRWPLEPPDDDQFRVVSRETKTFRIRSENREEVLSVDRLKAAVPDTPPDEPYGSLPSGPPPPLPSTPPSRILPLPLSLHPPTASSSSPTSSTHAASHTHSSPVPPVYTTRSGRKLHFPDRFVTHVFSHKSCLQRRYTPPLV